MRDRQLVRVGIVAIVTLLACIPAAAEDPPAGIPVPPPPRMPRGLITNEAGVTDGYVLFSPAVADKVYLVNNAGEVVHTWTTQYSMGGGIYLGKDGLLMRPSRDPGNLTFRPGGTGGILQKLDWEGSVVWEWRLSDDRRVLHHDVELMPGGNVLALAWEVKTPEEARRAGRRPDMIPETGLFADYLLEIQPLPSGGGKVVWEWHVWDHLVQDHDPDAENYGELAANPGRIDINGDSDTPDITPEELAQLQALGYVSSDATAADVDADFLHINAVTYHPRLEQIALCVPTFGEVWILDHALTTKGARGRKGDLLYRFGNPAAYGRGPEEDQLFFYHHDVRWIPDGWEGAGNLTVFNNGRGRPAGPWSSIDEWVPPVDKAGRYRIDKGRPFGPAGLSWQFQAEEPTSFFAPFISGAHRLENGNTMTCLGTDGSFFEINREGRIVWEYRNPFSGTMRLEDGTPPQPGVEHSPYATFRATRIPPDHPGLAGRELVPLDPQPEWFSPVPE